SWLRGRSDVDRDRIALSGSSFGGELVPRAAAYESRLAAISVDPGVVYAGSTWTDGLATFPGQLEAFEAGNTELFHSNGAGSAAGLSHNERFGVAQRLEIYPGTTMFEKYSQIVQYDNRSVLPRIRKPMLVINNEVEQFFPGQAKTLYDLLPRSKGKKYVTFTVSEGAQFHCEPMAPQRRNDTVMDFFDDAVGR
ncbi:MAG: alpha/beta hydrolase family protein, partial [Solirubrobacterales bacterium]